MLHSPYLDAICDYSGQRARMGGIWATLSILVAGRRGSAV